MCNQCAFFYERNQFRYVGLNLSLFFEQLTSEEKTYGNFMQDNATAHIAKNSMLALHELWPSRSHDFNSCDCYLLGTLKEEMYVNNPHSLEEHQ